MKHASKRQLQHYCALALAIALALIIPWPTHAQSAVQVTESKHEHIFGESITFSVAATSGSEIDSIKLFYRVSGQSSANKVELDFEPGTTVSAEHIEDMADESNYQPPMIEFTYWWLITDKDGNRLKTEESSFVYTDTHYEWQTLQDNLIRLYWHDQDQTFGQYFFDLAVSAAGALRDEFGVETPRAAPIVIYNSHQELMAVLQEASSEWTGAVTFGDTGVIAIGLGPMDWMDKVIPHELTHATLYMITKPPFGDIPRWLHEGLAMRSEGGMSSEEISTLDQAIQDDNLISLRVLNSSFPDQRERAILSYAESNSLITYIIEAYGTEKLGELLAVFAEGAHYDDAMLEVFGVDMDGMEDLWREHIGAPPRQGMTRATPVPSPTFTVEATQTTDPTATVEPTATQLAAATPIKKALQPTATSAPENTPTAMSQATPVPERGKLCLGALPSIALLALFAFVRPRAMK
ncbi:MAG: hypothetical protein JXA89_17430 [Anaerolineae bacterium]|nr:hypothetical protein [Anaerolineae bacterium]